MFGLWPYADINVEQPPASNNERNTLAGPVRIQSDTGATVRKPADLEPCHRLLRARAKAHKRNEEDRVEDDLADDGDDDEQELSASSVAGRARHRERVRCKAISEAALATGVSEALDLAAHFVFKTAMRSISTRAGSLRG